MGGADSVKRTIPSHVRTATIQVTDPAETTARRLDYSVCTLHRLKYPRVAVYRFIDSKTCFKV